MEVYSEFQKLGPRSKRDIPWDVYGEDDTVISDREQVLNRWKNDYFELYNDSSGDYDDSFRTEILNTKAHLERNMQDPLFVGDPQLSRPIQIDEVKKAVGHAKNRKAVGTDNIPKKVLKSPTVINVLHLFFQLCFDSGKIPSIWTQSLTRFLKTGLTIHVCH